MFIKTVKTKTSKFTKVYLAESYRVKGYKYPKNRHIKCFGNLEELQLEDPDILDKLKAEAKNMDKNIINVVVNLNESLEKSQPVLNYGYLFLESIYKSLEIDKFLDVKSKNYKFKYNLNNIMKLLVFSRILNPASKLETYENQHKFFEPFNVELENIYRSLDVMNDIKEDLQLLMHKQVTQKYGRQCEIIFYDVTNYYFEVDYDDEDIIDHDTGEITEALRKKGVCKSNTQKPLVAMGLLIDSKGIPVAYKLFKGNTSDSKTLIPVLRELKEKYNLGRIITTADKGLNSGNNLGYIIKNNDGYIVSQKIRGSKKEFIDTVLNQDGYTYNKKKTYKTKSILRERKVVYTDENGSKEDITLKEKVVIFWSKDYFDRARFQRLNLESKIEEYKKDPSKFKASNSYGLKRYFKPKQIDKKTGKPIKTKTELVFDEDKYIRDKELDGYYAIVTSEINLSEAQIVEKYRGLSKIEDQFRVLKSDLEGRPVYVKLDNHIEGHFLTCYLSLLITRVLQSKLNQDIKNGEKKISVAKIQKSLKEATCQSIGNGIYSLNESDAVLEKLISINNITLTGKMRYETIKKIQNKLSTF